MFQKAGPKVERDIMTDVRGRRYRSFKRSYDDIHPLDFYFDMDFQKGDLKV